MYFFFFSSRRRHTRSLRDWSSDVCSSDLDRDRAVSLSRTRATCLFTVFGLIDSRSAITRLEIPVISSARTSHSRAERPASRDLVDAQRGTSVSWGRRRAGGSASVANAIASAMLIAPPLVSAAATAAAGSRRRQRI